MQMYKMSKQIIIQPNRKFCLFSPITQNVTHYDLEPSEIIEIILEETRRNTEDWVTKICDSLENTGTAPAIYQSLSYSDMLATIKEAHGKSELKEVEKLTNPQHKRTSHYWNGLYIIRGKYLEIIDADGWDKKNWDYSWLKEEITEEEFNKRLDACTVQKVNT